VNWSNAFVNIENQKKLWGSEIEVLVNDQNLKPDWVTTPALNSEFFIRRKKEKLLIVIGESWTYGESLKDVSTGLKRYSLSSQVAGCFGARMALMMDVDYYQYAVPGNCNFYMFQELSRILDYVSTLGYNNVYVCMQMTEPAREMPISQKLINTPLNVLYKGTEKISFKKWLTQYDEIFFKWFDQIVNSYKEKCNIVDAVIWKNFCSTNTDRRYESFKLVEQSWIQYSARIMGQDLGMPEFYSIGWLASMQELHSNRIIFDIAYLNNQIDIIEQSNNFLTNNPYHYPHPNETAHMLWAQYLIKQVGWVNGI
jgi:hypothetical protein